MKNTELSTRDGFGKALEQLGENKDVVVVDGDVSDSLRSAGFAKKYPERFFSLGISEADMICTAAGMATCGKIPFVTGFASFICGRAFDQISVSVAYSNTNVKIVGSHAGLATGEDGPTAQCITDMALMRALPNMSVISPADAIEAEGATRYIASQTGPVYLRLTRPKSRAVFDDSYKFRFGKAAELRSNGEITVFSTGIVLPDVLDAADMLEKEGIRLSVYNMPTIKPIDRECIIKSKGPVVTVEDHNIIGGLGSAVAEVLSEEKPSMVLRIGVDDRFKESGSFRELYRKYGLDGSGIASRIKAFAGGVLQ